MYKSAYKCWFCIKTLLPMKLSYTLGLLTVYSNVGTYLFYVLACVL